MGRWDKVRCLVKGTRKFLFIKIFYSIFVFALLFYFIYALQKAANKKPGKDDKPDRVSDPNWNQNNREKKESSHDKQSIRTSNTKTNSELRPKETEKSNPTVKTSDKSGKPTELTDKPSEQNKVVPPVKAENPTKNVKPSGDSNGSGDDNEDGWDTKIIADQQINQLG